MNNKVIGALLGVVITVPGILLVRATEGGFIGYLAVLMLAWVIVPAIVTKVLSRKY